MTKLDLLARVVQHKNLFFKTSWAHYPEAVKGTLRVMPPANRLKALEVLKAALPAFVERGLKSAHGTKWLDSEDHGTSRSLDRPTKSVSTPAGGSVDS